MKKFFFSKIIVYVDLEIRKMLASAMFGNVWEWEFQLQLWSMIYLLLN